MWKRLGLILFVLGVTAAFPFGPLFPWSPWKPGFSHISSARGDVFYQEALPEAYRKLDALIADAETFHRVKTPRRVTVIVCSNWNQFRRFMPQHRGTSLGAVAVITGTVIYITPKLREMGFSDEEFLRHELSHAALGQNQTLRASYASGNTWFYEGLAVAFGRQTSYRSKDDFLRYAKQRSVAELIDPARRDSTFDIRMGYPAWRYFIERLIATKGRDAFQRYLEACMKEPGQWREQMGPALGISFDQAVAEFQSAIRDGRWEP